MIRTSGQSLVDHGLHPVGALLPFPSIAVVVIAIARRDVPARSVQYRQRSSTFRGHIVRERPILLHSQVDVIPMRQSVVAWATLLPPPPPRVSTRYQRPATTRSGCAIRAEVAMRAFECGHYLRIVKSAM
jgi:hypothetical protein